VDFVFGRSLAVRSAFFSETDFVGELPCVLFAFGELAAILGITEPAFFFNTAAASFTDLTVCGATKDFPFAALVPITVPATAPTTAPTGPAIALPTTAPATPPAVCLETGRFSFRFALGFFVAIKLIFHSGIVLGPQIGRLPLLKGVNIAEVSRTPRFKGMIARSRGDYAR
jgi:hypothetical protein